jgi:cytochrome o ubiquinol oxidase subunit 1
VSVLAWQPWLLIAAASALVILAGVVCQAVQLVVSIRHREQFRDTSGDRWDGRTLDGPPHRRLPPGTSRFCRT